MPPAKTSEVRLVLWIDSSLQNGQVDIHEFPKPVIVSSVGFVVKETETYIVIARDDMGEGEFRGLCAIPRIAITNNE
jgi:hypothetical protein